MWPRGFTLGLFEVLRTLVTGPSVAEAVTLKLLPTGSSQHQQFVVCFQLQSHSYSSWCVSSSSCIPLEDAQAILGIATVAAMGRPLLARVTVEHAPQSRALVVAAKAPPAPVTCDERVPCCSHHSGIAATARARILAGAANM